MRTFLIFAVIVLFLGIVAYQVQADEHLSPGDCNGDGETSSADITAVVLEIFDGDGTDPTDAQGGDFWGTYQCDSNQDGTINAPDISCVGLILFYGPLGCQQTAIAEQVVGDQLGWTAFDSDSGVAYYTFAPVDVGVWCGGLLAASAAIPAEPAIQGPMCEFPLASLTAITLDVEVDDGGGALCVWITWYEYEYNWKVKVYLNWQLKQNKLQEVMVFYQILPVI